MAHCEILVQFDPDKTAGVRFSASCWRLSASNLQSGDWSNYGTSIWGNWSSQPEAGPPRPHLAYSNVSGRRTARLKCSSERYKSKRLGRPTNDLAPSAHNLQFAWRRPR